MDREHAKCVLAPILAYDHALIVLLFFQGTSYLSHYTAYGWDTCRNYWTLHHLRLPSELLTHMLFPIPWLYNPNWSKQTSTDLSSPVNLIWNGSVTNRLIITCYYLSDAKQKSLLSWDQWYRHSRNREYIQGHHT